MDDRITNIESRLDSIPESGQDIWYLQQKVTDLEDRGRRNNLRIIGLPEQIKKDNISDFLSTLIPTLTNITFTLPLEFQRAHRVRSCGTDYSTRPRHILVCCLRHQQARRIIMAAKKHGPYEYEKSQFNKELKYKKKRMSVREVSGLD
ncbi:hypothetical protein NDU88_008600, partial [Pleurodeles waltl]